jgi:flagellar biosynthesis/type III secretory pathway protein FliH
VEEYQRLTWSKRRRLLAEYWEKQRRDAQAALGYAWDAGIERGLEMGVEKGREEGLAEGEKKAEAKYQPLIEEKDREIEELRRSLQDKGGN